MGCRGIAPSAVLFGRYPCVACPVVGSRISRPSRAWCVRSNALRICGCCDPLGAALVNVRGWEAMLGAPSEKVFGRPGVEENVATGRRRVQHGEAVLGADRELEQRDQIARCDERVGHPLRTARAASFHGLKRADAHSRCRHRPAVRAPESERLHETLGDSVEVRGGDRIVGADRPVGARRHGVHRRRDD
jgi:hypothetical protein